MQNQTEKEFKELFLDRGRYSSTTQCSLSSTTFKFQHNNYCAHCGCRALPIQDGLSGWHHHSHYDTTGYRCDCNEAVEEMIECTAIVLFKLNSKKDIKFPRFNINREAYLKLINNLPDHCLPLDGRDNHNRLIPVISVPDYQNFEHFTSDNNHLIKWSMKDEFYAEKDLVRFTRRVFARMEELARNQLEEAELAQKESLKMIADLQDAVKYNK